MKYSLDELLDKAFKAQKELISLGDKCAEYQVDYEQLHEFEDVVLRNNLPNSGAITLQELISKSSQAYREHIQGVMAAKRKYLRAKVAYGAQEVLCDLFRSVLSNAGGKPRCEAVSA